MKKVVLLILSTGWVITLVASMYLNFAFLENEVYPAIYDAKSQINSFPYIYAARTLLNITAAWFCIVLIAWSAFF
jgi:hypothetical protein